MTLSSIMSLPAAPDAPPQNVMTMIISSTAIEVIWEEVPEINHNGIIIMYEVQYEPLETFDGQISTDTVNITNISILSTVLTGLEEFVQYNISVRAYTIIGPGPYSTGVVERTDTDGKLKSQISKSMSFLFTQSQ